MKTRELKDKHCVLQCTNTSKNICDPIPLDKPKNHTALPYITIDVVLLKNNVLTNAFDTKHKPRLRICKQISDKSFDAQDSSGEVSSVSIQHLQLLHATEHVLITYLT